MAAVDFSGTVPTLVKIRLGKGNVFSRVCLSVQGMGPHVTTVDLFKPVHLYTRYKAILKLIKFAAPAIVQAAFGTTSRIYDLFILFQVLLRLMRIVMSFVGYKICPIMVNKAEK